MRISKEEAVDALYAIIDSGIISCELEEKLEDIVNCIKADEFLYIRGADD